MPMPPARFSSEGDDIPIAVVAGAGSTTGLGSARALRLAGARVWGLSTRRKDATLKSRAWERLDLMPSDPEAWIDTINRLSGEIRQPAFLLPTSDLLVAELSARRIELDARYRIVMPADPIVRTFLQKTLFYEWGRPKGLPLPDSALASSDSELRFALRNIPYPLVIKPTYRTASWNRASPNHKVIHLRAPEDFARIPFDLFTLAPSFIISHWIEGPDSAVHYCLVYCARPGQVTECFTGKKLLQYPRQTGSTAICVSTRNGEIEDLAREVFRHADFHGIGSLEVKYDEDGRAWITEPTVGRPNLQSYSAVAGGCNLHAIAMAHALQRDPTRPADTRRRCWWVEERNLGELVVSGGIPMFPWRVLGREMLDGRRPSFAYWSWRDPLPAIFLAGHFVGRATRAFLKLMRRVVTGSG